MVGHFLLHLTQEQEDRLLTCTMGYAPKYINNESGCRCLVGVVRDAYHKGWSSVPAFRDSTLGQRTWDGQGVAIRFDALCTRFGDARIANAVRDRVLTNRLWRARSASEAFAYLEPVES